MSTPVLPRLDVSFAQIKQQVEEGVRTGNLVLDLALLAPELAPSLEDVLRHVQIGLGAVQADIGNAELSVRGNWKLGSVPFAVEARFANAASGVDCTVAIAPVRNPLSAIGGDLARLLALLPIKPADFWITLSTVERRAANIEIEGHRVANATIAKGRGYLMRFEGRLLELAALEDTVFSLGERLAKPVFRANLDKTISVANLLDLHITGLAFASVEQLSIAGTGTIRLFGASLTCAGDLMLALRSIGFSADVDAVVSQLDRVFFHGFTLRKSRVSVNGTLAAYTVGVSGEFVIAGSGNSGMYEAQYAVGNTTPIPDLFQLEAARVTPSDVLTVMTGATVRLPDSLNRLIVLEGVHLYYSTQDGLLTRSQVPSRRGAAVHGDVVLLGYRGYAEAEVMGDECRVKLLLSPISLAGILDIGGSGKATPASYKGTKVKAGAIQLEVDTQRKQAVGDISVRFLKQAAVATRAVLGEHALEFAVDVSLPQPLGKLTYATALEHQRARMTASLDIHVGISDFGVHIPRLASVKGKISQDVGLTDARIAVAATIALGPLSLPLSLTLDGRDIERLAEKIVEAVEREVSRALENAIEWLRVALEGLIRAGTQHVEQVLMGVGNEFKRRFERSAADAARELKAAGYAMEQALSVLHEVPVREWMRTFGSVGAYTSQEIVKGISKLCEQAKPEHLAYEVGHLLKSGGMRAEELVGAVSGIATDAAKAAQVLAQLDRPVKDVAQLLKGAGKTAAQAAEIIGGAFGDLDKDLVKDSMKAVRYAEQEVVDAVETLWREGGRFVRNLQEEVQRAWRRYTPSIRITIRW